MISDILSSYDPVPRAPSSASCAVLVVEDHPTYRALLGWFLQKLGVDYVVVANGHCALLAIAGREFGLVISDCQMPLMDGYAMAREIRLRERHQGRQRVPIIALTAHLAHQAPRHSIEADIDAWLPKPLTFTQLIEVLGRWLPGVAGLPTTADTLGREASWPTRARLLDTFGSEQIVNRILQSLLREADEDSAALAHACLSGNQRLTAQRLHRLIGSLAFLGDGQLESTGMALIERISSDGVASNAPQLEAFQCDLRIYLAYLRHL